MPHHVEHGEIVPLKVSVKSGGSHTHDRRALSSLLFLRHPYAQSGVWVTPQRTDRMS